MAGHLVAIQGKPGSSLFPAYPSQIPSVLPAENNFGVPPSAGIELPIEEGVPGG